MNVNALRVLVVEDNPEDYEIIRILFSKVRQSRYELENARSLSEALKKLAQKKHDAYLVDYKLGADSGIDFLRYAVQQENAKLPSSFSPVSGITIWMWKPPASGRRIFSIKANWTRIFWKGPSATL